jgi:C-terminal processing protease CtpA/Prc
MVYPYGEKNGAYELAAVNGVELKRIYGAYNPSENENSAVFGLSRIMLAEYLKRAGVEWQDSLTFTYKKADGSLFDVEHGIIADEETKSDASAQIPKNFEAKITDDGVLYIYARAMSDDGSYEDCIDFIKNAVKNGIKRAVIDVRRNGGGSDSFGLGILDALGFEFSQMGFTIKYSKTTAKYRGTWRSSGYKNVAAFEYRSKNKNGIELKVFCDEYTASAAMTLVNQCRYSDLGEIIGRMSGQNTNFCGNAVMFQLTYSKVCYRLPLSYCYFERDGQKAPDRLIPDIEVSALANYLDFVNWK